KKDFEKREPGSPEEKNECGGLRVRAARLRHAAGDRDLAKELVQRVLREAAGSPAAADAEALQQGWQGR
ncbi:MAG: hypothetical protein KA020_10415, partial [Planctomycetes bacterium]|nr:hypothetical protein [Planctomycetota bacterium]